MEVNWNHNQYFAKLYAFNNLLPNKANNYCTQKH